MTKLRGKAPLRISFAGGGTDLNYIFEKHGGAVVNCTIDKYVHMTIEKRTDSKIFINSKELDDSEPLAKKIVEYAKPDFGFNLTYYNDFGPKSGLGNSSAFTILLLRLMGELDNERLNDYELVRHAYNIETQVVEGGWQDQYAAVFGGFNFLEFDNKHTVYPLRLRYSFICELNEHLLLVKVNSDRTGDIHKDIRLNTDEEELNKTLRQKELAYIMRDYLLNQKIDKIGALLHEVWIMKKNKYVTNDTIDKLYELGLIHGAEGGKLMGAGQGGHFMFFVRPEYRNRLKEEINKSGLGEVVKFNLDIHGAETWSSLL